MEIRCISFALPGAVRPMALGFKTDEIKRLISIDDAGTL
jgi:hypothetical protein